ncbi:MAG TPA: MBL fold metallo-hydrolase [Actinomycetes bacterium]|nr:MBL fold metallo-hydrolase [Actinomycetes bacterium]
MGVQTTLSFLGAAGTVTGSKFLVDTQDCQVLVDAGLFQGLRALRRRNWEPFPLPASDVDAIVLTHAHLDHCGYLPALVDQGFSGPVVATQATADLAALVLRDSAKLQEEDARYAAKKGFSKHAAPRPLYDAADVARVLPLFTPVGFHERFSPVEGCQVTLQPAGHILGSSTVLLELGGRRVVFSGDLGRPGHPLLVAPPPPPACDAIVVESTYGDRGHQTEGLDQLAAIISRTVGRGGVVVIPAFAVDRTEVVLMALKQLTDEGRIPATPVFVDSPMALGALRIYRSALDRDSPDVRTDLGPDSLVFDPGDLREAHTAQESMDLNDPGRPCVIVSASGMATGGRVVHHLRHLLPDPKNAVVLVGYQAVGTRGRDLAEGVPQLKMHGRYVPVRAEVAQVEGFSVHADGDEIIAWLAGIPEPPQAAYVVHGEPRAAGALAGRIRDELGWLAVVPRDGERVLLT